MIDVSKFNSSIINPYMSRKGCKGFSEVMFDENVGDNVLHVRKFQTLIQALGYFKYTQCISPANNFRVFFRGQEKAYGKAYQPSLYRKCCQEGTVTHRDGMLNRQIALARKCCKWFEKVDDAVIEGVFQQYGMRTRWIDAVDNIWIALWFACHHAWTWSSSDFEYIHYSIRSPLHEGDGPRFAYIYVLGFNSGYRDVTKKRRRKFVAGMTWGENAEMLDLRYAVPSLFIRPHAQHGVLLRSFENSLNGAVRFKSNMKDLILGVIRFDLEDGLEWLGNAASFDVSSIFPPPAYDSGYCDLLKTEMQMRETYLNREVELHGYAKRFRVTINDLLRIQKMS